MDPEPYDRGAIALHWITAALVVANLVLGVSMAGLPISPRKLNWYLWHKSIGISVLVLTSLRVAWRLLRPHPAPVPMPAWQARAARASHLALYLLLFAIPLSGWIYSSATGVQVVYLNFVPLPDLVPRNRALGDALRWVHIGLNSVLAMVVLLHAAAALKHHFLDHDVVLRRMLPPWRNRSSAPR
jgi:cytochrome b561